MNRRSFLQALGIGTAGVAASAGAALATPSPEAPIAHVELPLPLDRFPAHKQGPVIDDWKLLTRDVEVEFLEEIEGSVRIRLHGRGALAGNARLSMLALYHYLAELMDAHLDLTWPLDAVTKTQFAFRPNCGFFDDASRDLIARGSWVEGEDRHIMIQTLGDFPDNEPVRVTVGNKTFHYKDTGPGCYRALQNGSEPISISLPMRERASAFHFSDLPLQGVPPFLHAALSWLS